MEIPAPRFRIERGGYVVEDVDALLNQFFAQMDSNPRSVTAAGLRAVRFRSSPGRPGYAQSQVNDWLEAVSAQLANSSASILDEPANRSTRESSPESVGAQPVRRDNEPAQLPSLDPALDPGRNAVQELPATPPWVALTVLGVLAAMILFFAISFFR